MTEMVPTTPDKEPKALPAWLERAMLVMVDWARSYPGRRATYMQIAEETDYSLTVVKKACRALRWYAPPGFVCSPASPNEDGEYVWGGGWTIEAHAAEAWQARHTAARADSQARSLRRDAEREDEPAVAALMVSTATFAEAFATAQRNLITVLGGREEEVA